MNIRKLTASVVMLTIVVLALYDVYAFTEGGTEGTISHLLMTWGYNYPMVPFVGGVLVGHFWWRIREVKGYENLGKTGNVSDKQ